MNKRTYFAVLIWLSVFWFGCASTSTNTPKKPGISSANLGYIASEATSAGVVILWKVHTKDTTDTPFLLGLGYLRMRGQFPLVSGTFQAEEPEREQL